MTYHPPPSPIMDDEDEDGPTCPLCLEELDATDRAVEACHCGYQVCLWCLHHIREQLNSRCPACRTPYQEQNFKYAEVNHEEAAKEAKERATAKKERERREKIREIEKERARAAAVSQQKAKNNLKHARILQKNLVYVIGLSLTLAREDIIRRADMFGKFGRLTRILVNRSHPFNTDAPGGPSISAYVQYVRDSDASAAVRAMNNAVLDGREIRCAIATTKYCDAFVRSAAASDPNAAHFCGNNNCMYYHSLSQEATLSREEVLARQLGPPPPAHLFLPPDTRRLHPGMRMPHSSPAPSGRPIPSRPIINAAPTTAQGAAIHPPSTLLPNTSAPIINPPLQSAPTTFSSPLPSPRHSAPFVARKPVNVASPHRTPPSSPPESHAPVTHINRSPRADESTVHRGSLSALGESSQVPVRPSTKSRFLGNVGWDHSNLGQGISRSQPRAGASVPIEDVSRPRLHGRLSLSPENVPPGFDGPSSPRSSTSILSRPPGFEGPVLKRATADRSPDHDVLQRANEIPTHANIAPPPGFGPGPTVRKDTQPEAADDVAAAWSQEASTDQVFLAKSRQVKGRAVGQVGARQKVAAQDDPNARSELAQVLAKIGGDLGVSSEFHDVRTSSSLLSTGRKPLLPSDTGGVNSQKPVAGPNPLDSLFGNEPSNNAFVPSSQNLLCSAGDTANGDSIGTYSFSQPFDAVFPASPIRGSFATTRSEVSSTARRSDSRFGFARENSPKDTTMPTSKISPSLSFSTPSSTMRRTDVQGNQQGGNDAFRIKGVPTIDSSSSMMRVLKESSQDQAPKPPQLPRRQGRSRFDFADQGSSPKAKRVLQTDSRVGFAPSSVAMLPPQASPTSSTKSLVNDAFILSFAQLSREEKLASLFNSAQWSADQLPPMPTVDTQPDSTVPLNTSGAHSIRSTDSDSVNHRPFKSPPVVTNHLPTASSTSGRVPLTTASRSTRSTPPGFREATPGKTPETSDVDNVSASSGVATTVPSGGAASTTSSTNATNDSNIVSNASETMSSGAESLEDDRKKNRAQRKRDKKARQFQEPTEERASAVRESVSKPTPLHESQQVQSARPSQISQPTQRHAGQTVIPIQAPGPDPCNSSGSSIHVRSTLEKDGRAAREHATVVSSPNSLTAMGDQIQDARIPIQKLPPEDMDLVGVPSKDSDENDKYVSVSDIEKEIEAARAREAQLRDKLSELERRIRSYDNIRT